MVGYESSRKCLLAASHPFSCTDCGSPPVSFTSKHIPDPLCVYVLFVCYVLVIQLAVKHLFVQQPCLAKSYPWFHVLVREEEAVLPFEMVVVIFNVSFGVALTSESRLPCRKLKLSMKCIFPNWKWDVHVFLHVVGNASHLVLQMRHCLHKVVHIIALQVVECNWCWDHRGFYLHFQIACIVHGSGLPAHYVAMVLYIVFSFT